MASSVFLGAGGSVDVAAAGALGGDGSAGDPLEVLVDGVTITIVGNELVGAASGAPTDAQYWVAAANGDLSAEVVVNSANSLASAIGSETTGSANFVRATSPALTTPTVVTSELLTRTAVGTGTSDGYALINTTDAADGAQQYSPVLRLTGEGWDANDSVTRVIDWILQNQPIQGNTVTAELTALTQLEGGGYGARFRVLSSNGSVEFGADSADTRYRLNASDSNTLKFDKIDGGIVQIEANALRDDDLVSGMFSTGFGVGTGGGYKFSSSTRGDADGGPFDTTLSRPAAFRAVISGATGTGNVSGNGVGATRNASGSGAASYIYLEDLAGTAYYLWVDATGDLRIGTAPPQEDGNPADTSGTVVGTQS